MHIDLGLVAGLDQAERGVEVDREAQVAAALELGRIDQGGDIAERPDQLLERDLAVGIGGVRVLQADREVAGEIAGAVQLDADEAEPRGDVDTRVRCLDVEADPRRGVLDEQTVERIDPAERGAVDAPVLGFRRVGDVLAEDAETARGGRAERILDLEYRDVGPDLVGQPQARGIRVEGHVDLVVGLGLDCTDQVAQRGIGRQRIEADVADDAVGGRDDDVGAEPRVVRGEPELGDDRIAGVGGDREARGARGLGGEQQALALRAHGDLVLQHLHAADTGVVDRILHGVDDVDDAAVWRRVGLGEVHRDRTAAVHGVHADGERGIA